MKFLLMSNTNFRLGQFIISTENIYNIFTKTDISKSNANYSNDTGKNPKAFADPNMLENITKSFKMELN